MDTAEEKNLDLVSPKNLLLIDRSLNSASMGNLKDVVDPAKTHMLVVDLNDPSFGVLGQLAMLPADTYTSVGIVVFGSEIVNWGNTLLSKQFAQMLQSICVNADETVLPSVDIFAWGLPLQDASILSLSISLQKGMAVFITNKQTGDFFLERCYLAGRLLSVPETTELVGTGDGLDLVDKYLEKNKLEKKSQFVFSTRY